MNSKIALLSLALPFILSASILADDAPRWIRGTGSATGTDIEAITAKALNNARADALKQAGVVVQAGDLMKKTETEAGCTDYYSQFAESHARGLILEERNIVLGDPVRVSKKSQSFEVTVSLEAQVAVQNGTPDPGFEVRLESNREAYQEGEPVFLTVTSTRQGYLTVFDIVRDSLNVIFPNSIDRNNRIFANAPFRFPPSDIYTLELTADSGKKSGNEEFVAVVTADSLPFPNVEDILLAGERLKVKQALLSAYAKWLYKIPVDKRCADAKVLQVLKKESKNN